MATHPLRQADFSGGEIAPLAQGRTDAIAYHHGLRLALNFIPTLEGPLLNRPGTRFVCAVKDSTYAPRLVSFKFSDGQNFILEVGNLYVRFCQGGGQILNLGVPYEVATPWAIADVPRLKFAQDGDVVSVTHPAYQPQQITRISNTNWTVTAIDLAPLPASHFIVGGPVAINLRRLPDAGNRSPMAAMAPDDWASAKGSGPGGSLAFGDFVTRQDAGGAGAAVQLYVADSTPTGDPRTGNGWFPLPNPALGGALGYSKNDYAWDPAAPGAATLYISLLGPNNTNPPGAANQWALATDNVRVARPTQWAVTALWQDSNGRRHETLGSAPTQPLPLYVGKDRPATIHWGGGVIPASPGFILLGWNIYRGIKGVYGLSGTMGPETGVGDPDGVVFLDDNDAPDFSRQPPRGTNPFDIATGANTKTQSWPGATGFHEQRQLFARSDKKPQDVWGSAQNDYTNFDINSPVIDSATYDHRVASGDLEEIRSLLSLRYLLLFTGQGVYGAYGPAGAISQNSIFLRRYSQTGASYLQPVIVENGAIYQTSKNQIRDLLWSWQSDGYVSRNLSNIARHLFDGGLSIVDHCYAETPFSLIFAPRSDGALLTLTYSPVGINAWARATTQGFFERVAAITEANASGVPEDRVYSVVKRTLGSGATVRYIERFSSRLLPTRAAVDDDGNPTTIDDVRRGNFLDCSVQFDGRNVGATTLSVDISHGLDAGVQTVITASANTFVLADVGSSLVLDPDKLLHGPYTFKVIGFTDATHVAVELDNEFTAGPTDFPAPTTSWGWARKTITGLGQLEGLAVTALADGGVAGPFTVAGGAITLGSPAVIVQVGLSYNSDMETLDVGADQVKTNVKSIRSVNVEVVASRGLYVGQDFQHLVTPPQMRVRDVPGPPPLVTKPMEANIPSSFAPGGRICVRQSDPLPLSIVAVVRELELGGR